MTGSSITINFHSRWGKKNYLKTKKYSKFRRHALLCDRMFKLILHAEGKAWVFADGFCSHFISRGLASHSKIWIKLRSNTVHYHFCFLKSRKLLEIRNLYSKPTWQRTDLVNASLYLPSKMSNTNGLIGNVKLCRSRRWSRQLMYPLTTTLIHSNFFETELLEQNILFQLTCVVCSLQRAPVQNKSWRPSLKTNFATICRRMNTCDLEALKKALSRVRKIDEYQIYLLTVVRWRTN